MKKTLCALLVLLLSNCMLFGCTGNQTPQRVLILDNKETLNEDIFITVVNDTENERFSVTYEARGENKDFETFFSFSLSNHEKKLWSTWGEGNDESVPLVLSCAGGKELTGDNTLHGSYDINGETTVYVSYAGLSDELKNMCIDYTGNNCTDTETDSFSISVNGYHVATSD